MRMLECLCAVPLDGTVYCVPNESGCFMFHRLHLHLLKNNEQTNGHGQIANNVAPPPAQSILLGFMTYVIVSPDEIADFAEERVALTSSNTTALRSSAVQQQQRMIMFGLRSLALALSLCQASAFAGVVSAAGGAFSSKAGGGARALGAATPPWGMDAGDQHLGEMLLSPIDFRGRALPESAISNLVSRTTKGVLCVEQIALACWHQTNVHLHDDVYTYEAHTNECVPLLPLRPPVKTSFYCQQPSAW